MVDGFACVYICVGVAGNANPHLVVCEKRKRKSDWYILFDWTVVLFM